MKKVICVLLLTAVVVGGAFAQAGETGRIRELMGDVEIKRAGSSNYVRASAGDIIALNTLVSTGFRSSAVIEIGSSVITVRPLTRLSLAEIQKVENSENVHMELQSGRVRVDVKPPSGTRTTFNVQSPSATASVRGTSFEFDTVNLTVDEGRVIFVGNAGPGVIVDAGGASLISADATSADPVDVITALLLPPSPQGAPPPEVIAPSSASSSSEGSGLVDADFGLLF